ncbi:hypothetical protein CSAL01_05403 [Colletotrichum salicis]|uniref:Uncharacterized protein n=1 Tax=Colletotrichum salicis TaxID=1209931 RepID=A0A135V8U6_9PEZI|nr:hypothetical protein CSAL01_05403 [Colletotrichum salicis]
MKLKWIPRDFANVRSRKIRIFATGPDRVTRVYRAVSSPGESSLASSRTRPFPARQGTFGQSSMMCAAPTPRPSLCPLHDGSDRRHLVPEPAQYFATFPKSKGAEEIQIIKWYLLKPQGIQYPDTSWPTDAYTGEAFLENPSRSIRNMGAATVFDYMSLQNFSKRQHGRGYPLSHPQEANRLHGTP